VYIFASTNAGVKMAKRFVVLVMIFFLPFFSIPAKGKILIADYLMPAPI